MGGLGWVFVPLVKAYLNGSLPLAWGDVMLGHLGQMLMIACGMKCRNVD
jgi:hypothetical protein